MRSIARLAAAVLAIAAIFGSSGCERAADGRTWLADREEYRPAPEPVEVLDQLQASADRHPLADMADW